MKASSRLKSEFRKGLVYLAGSVMARGKIRPDAVRAIVQTARRQGIRVPRSLRAVVLLVSTVLLAACNGAVSDNGPGGSDPCDVALAECVAACPANQGPGATARDACEAGCQAEHSLCVVPVPEALTCERVGEDHGCASSGCWGVYACNRNPGPEQGTTCDAVSEGVFKCRW